MLFKLFFFVFVFFFDKLLYCVDSPKRPKERITFLLQYLLENLDEFFLPGDLKLWCACFLHFPHQSEQGKDHDG